MRCVLPPGRCCTLSQVGNVLCCVCVCVCVCFNVYVCVCVCFNVGVGLHMCMCACMCACTRVCVMCVHIFADYTYLQLFCVTQLLNVTVLDAMLCAPLFTTHREDQKKVKRRK